MPRYLVRIVDQEDDFYMEWSTIVDAPTTYGMKLDEMTEYYRDRYGSAAAEEFQERIARCQDKGTSCQDGTTLDRLLAGNRAGPNEKELTLDQIIEQYIRNRPKDDPS